MKVSFHATAKSNVFKMKNKDFFIKYVSTLPDGEYILTLEKQKKKRSINQNRYYFGVVLPILLHHFRQIGFNNIQTHEQVHEILKFKFLKESIVNDDGTFLERIKSTTELSTSEFMDYVAEIQQWAAEQFDLDIPDPNEILELKL